ncbi:MAG TPA: hypothetical protein VGF08_06935, partial [Terriglobales bacterium]
FTSGIDVTTVGHGVCGHRCDARHACTWGRSYWAPRPRPLQGIPVLIHRWIERRSTFNTAASS